MWLKLGMERRELNNLKMRYKVVSELVGECVCKTTMFIHYPQVFGMKQAISIQN